MYVFAKMADEMRYMKTVNEIIIEYRNRQKTPEYSLVVFQGGLTFHNVTNLKYNDDSTSVSGRFWEGDSSWNGVISHFTCKSDIHSTIQTIPTEKVVYVGDGKKYKKIIVCTHSGEREVFNDVENIIEDKKNRIVEFDIIYPSHTTHVIKNPGSLEHSEEIN